MQMPSIFVRARSNARSFELRVKHPLLGKPVYRTFDSREDAERAGRAALEELGRNVVPSWLQPDDRPQLRTVGQAIHQYRRVASPPRSTELLLDTIARDIGTTALSTVDFAWAEQWIRQMKVTRLSTPGTIRKKKGALSAVLDWVREKHPQCLASNPLRRLPHGYSAYNRRLKAELAAMDKDVPFDEERDRRIGAQEEARIVEALAAQIEAAKNVDDKARAEGMLLMFQLALQTAMRMRELYTLSVAQVKLAERTIALERTKNGDKRQVPLNRAALKLLQSPWPALDAVRRDGLLLPFWDGDLDEDALRKTTSKVSKLFQQVFAKVGCVDLHFHDTRHEAVCRWVLNAPVPLTSEEVGRAAGMRDARTRQRYLSLRGNELADKLG
jgi:integrase